VTQITGTVFKVYPKTWPAQGGKPGNTTYSVKLDGDPMYYRTPRGKGKGSDGDPLTGIAEPGAVISFKSEPINEKSAQIVAGTVTKVEKTDAPAPVAGAVTGGGSPAYSGGGQSYAQRDASIQYQSSRKDAIALVDTLIRAGAITLPAKAAAKLEALEACVDMYTANFYADIGTLGAIARANGTAKEADVAPAGGEEE
jgi:hypothetical protein